MMKLLWVFAILASFVSAQFSDHRSSVRNNYDDHDVMSSYDTSPPHGKMEMRYEEPHMPEKFEPRYEEPHMPREKFEPRYEEPHMPREKFEPRYEEPHMPEKFEPRYEEPHMMPPHMPPHMPKMPMKMKSKRKEGLDFCGAPGCNHMTEYDSSGREVCVNDKDPHGDKEKCLVYDCASEEGTYDDKGRIGPPRGASTQGHCCDMCSREEKCVAWSFKSMSDHKECSLYWAATEAYGDEKHPEYRSKKISQCHTVMPEHGHGYPDCKGSCKKHGKCFFDEHSHDCSCRASSKKKYKPPTYKKCKKCKGCILWLELAYYGKEQKVFIEIDGKSLYDEAVFLRRGENINLRAEYGCLGHWLTIQDTYYRTILKERLDCSNKNLNPHGEFKLADYGKLTVVDGDSKFGGIDDYCVTNSNRSGGDYDFDHHDVYDSHGSHGYGGHGSHGSHHHGGHHGGYGGHHGGHHGGYGGHHGVHRRRHHGLYAGHGGYGHSYGYRHNIGHRSYGYHNQEDYGFARHFGDRAHGYYGFSGYH